LDLLEYGKTLFAKEFAKMILCTGEKMPCGKCKSCLQFEQNNQPDFTLIEPEEGTIKIEKIRQMQEKVLEKPIISSKKLYIIKDADYMTKEAGNCLLKTLEEPPEYVTIILIGANESLFLNTIRSRCMKVLFQKISDEELQKYLEKNNIAKELTKERLKAFNGSIEKAIKIEEKKEIYDEIQKIFGNIEQYTLLDVLGKLELLYKNKEIINDLLDYITIIFLEKAKSDIKYISNIETIEEIKKNLKANSNFDMSIDKLLYKIWEE
jgi:DNA polymerase-3 subunit delta'